MTPVISVNTDLRPEVWRIWRAHPKNLIGATVSLDESGRDFDFDSWNALQESMLDKLLNTMTRGVVTIHNEEAASEIQAFGLRPLSQKRFYDIMWLQWLPTISRRRSYLLLNRKELHNLVESSAWVEYSGTFLLFGSHVDDNLINRFVHQKWTDTDRFIAVTPITDYPYWVVATNYLDQESLTGLLRDISPAA